MSHTLCVWKHKLYIWLETHSICHHIYTCNDIHSFEPITPTMQDITGGICMPSYALSMTSYPHFMATVFSICDITCTIYDMSFTGCYITFTICVTSHNDCFYDMTHSTFMKYLLYMASHTALWQPKHCVLHNHYVWYHTHCICVILYMMTSYPFYTTSHSLYL